MKVGSKCPYEVRAPKSHVLFWLCRFIESLHLIGKDVTGQLHRFSGKAGMKLMKTFTAVKEFYIGATGPVFSEMLFQAFKIYAWFSNFTEEVKTKENYILGVRIL